MKFKEKKIIIRNSVSCCNILHVMGKPDKFPTCCVPMNIYEHERILFFLFRLQFKI